VPEELVTDNGPQFTSHDFAEFATEYDFKHATSSPYFAQSNGAAERAVQTTKHILRQEDPFLALLSYRANAHASTGVSPAQLLMGRAIRSTVPVMPANLLPGWPDLQLVEDNDRQAKESYQHYYNAHGARPLPELQPGDTVDVKLDTQKQWLTPGVVHAKTGAPRSYLIDTPHGTIRHNRRHLKLSTVDPQQLPVPIDDDEYTPQAAVAAPIPAVPTTPPRGVPPINTMASPVHNTSSPVTTTRCGRAVKVPLRYRD
jgi:hypothetical protein